jgi:hypothetical protein
MDVAATQSSPRGDTSRVIVHFVSLELLFYAANI